MPETDDVRWVVSPALRQRMVDVARHLRVRSTTGEAELWSALRRQQFAGRKFRRQQPVGPFVLDFYCPDEQLAVEVDGGVHDDPLQATLDAERQSLIESLGIRFVRLPNGLVLNDLAGALRTIAAAFRSEAPSLDQPSPLVGEGGRRRRPGEGAT